jgi:hypothetical protein
VFHSSALKNLNLAARRQMEWRQFIDAAHLAKGPSVVYGPWLPEEAGNAQKNSRIAAIRFEHNKVAPAERP